MNGILQNMDLVDSNYAMFYGNCSDVGYMIDKEEHYLDVDDCGEVTVKLMRDYRKEQRVKNKEYEYDLEDDLEDEPEDEPEDESEAKDEYPVRFNPPSELSDGNDLIAGIDRLYESAPRTDEEWAESNLRFLD